MGEQISVTRLQLANTVKASAGQPWQIDEVQPCSIPITPAWALRIQRKQIAYSDPTFYAPSYLALPVADSVHMEDLLFDLLFQTWS